MAQETETDIKEVTSEGENSEIEIVVKTALANVEDLKSILIDKTVEIEELYANALIQQNMFQAEVSSLKTQVEELAKALDDANKAKEDAETELRRIHEDALLQRRVRELTECNLLRSSEEAIALQRQKIKGMTDADFEIYKDELMDVRNQALGTITSLDKESKGLEVLNSNVPEAKEVTEIIGDSISEDAKTKICQLIAELQPTSVQAEGDGQEITPEPHKESASSKSLPVSELARCFTEILKIR